MSKISGLRDDKAVEVLSQSVSKIRELLAQRIIGQKEVIDQILTVLFCGGHALIIGVPGLAKTLIVSTLARALDLKFSRIQFTPDLMPSDITGTEVLEENKSTGERIFRFVKGPVFGNIILADEINRTPPKTQSALLQAMQEHEVTVGEKTYKLPEPFFVLATQNPIEQEGTYPLPEAQLDRFAFEIRIDYPALNEEIEIVKTTTGELEVIIEPTLSASDVIELQRLVRRVPVSDRVVELAVRIATQTRPAKTSFDFIKKYVRWGAGPRASQFMIIASKAKAIMEGRLTPTPDDVFSVVYPVLRHRIITSFNAEAEGISTDNIIDNLLKEMKI